MSVCTRCGTTAPFQAQFCAACGSSLPVPSGFAPTAAAAVASEPQVRAPAYVRPGTPAPVVSPAQGPGAYVSSVASASMPAPAGSVVFDPSAFRVHWSHDALRGFLVSYGASGVNARGEFWPLHGGRWALGRVSSGELLEIVMPDSTISTRHAVLSVDGLTGLMVLEDLRSTNGTFVNEEILGPGGRRELRDGDRIRFGGYTTVLKLISKV